MKKRPALTQLSELGEFKLIERLTGDLHMKQKSTIKGVGDDAAVIDYGDELIVLTTDMLVEGIHFNLVYTPLRHLGYKAVVVNLSDVYAMNAIPGQITVSIAVSAKFSVEGIEELYSGIKQACNNYEVDLVGGDTTSSMSGLIISITAAGTVPRDRIVYRNTARENDLICVSGDLGAAYIGLQLLEREKRIFEAGSGVQPELTGWEYVMERQLKPEAPRQIIKNLENTGILPTAMIDLSDGLSSDLLHICKQSQKGCRIYQDKIPIDMETVKLAGEMNIEPFLCALNGGEDYELLFTTPLEDHDKLAKLKDVHIIGHMTSPEAGTAFVTSEGSQIVLHAHGWDALI